MPALLEMGARVMAFSVEDISNLVIEMLQINNRTGMIVARLDSDQSSGG
jgi:hypothetical protein